MKLGELHRQNKQTRIDLEAKAERKVQYKALKYAMRDITKWIKDGGVNVSIELSPSFFKYKYDKLLYKWFSRNGLKTDTTKFDDNRSPLNYVKIQIVD